MWPMQGNKLRQNKQEFDEVCFEAAGDTTRTRFKVLYSI